MSTEDVERMRRIIQTGRWPSGLPITPRERLVLGHNLARAEGRIDGKPMQIFKPEKVVTV